MFAAMTSILGIASGRLDIGRGVRVPLVRAWLKGLRAPRLWRLGGPILGLLFAFPAHAVNIEKIDKEMRRRYPNEEFVVAMGLSSDRPEIALDQARAEVSRQIRSDIQSVIRTIAQSENSNGHSDFFAQICRETESHTSFGHAELIRRDDKMSKRQGDQWVVVCYLNRDEAGQYLQNEYDIKAAAFRAAAKQLLAPSGDLVQWTATLRLAQVAFNGLLEPGFSLRGLQRSPAGMEDDVALFNQIESERSRRLGEIRMGLRIEPTAEDAGPLGAYVGSALSSMGVGLVTSDCDQGGYLLDLEPRFKWESGLFGPVIRLAVSGRLLHCGSQSPIAELAVSGKDGFVGMDVRDRAQAMANMWQSVDKSRILMLLRTELSRYLPVSQM